MSGLFSIFNVSTRGMSTTQKAIHVTSHNISNANTEGYSRQRATMETTRPFGMPSVNNAVGPGQLGTGSQVSAIQRVRDTFLDYQIRTETSRYGQFEAKYQFLTEVESILNEPGDTGISTLIGKFFDSWQVLSKDAQSSNNRTIVVQQSQALADALNHTANQLEKLKANISGTEGVVINSVFEVNNILDQIDQLNQQIIGVKVAGQMPNDLMDRRDQLIDSLSSKFNLKIEKNNFEGYDIKQEDVTGDQYLIKSENSEDVRRLSFVDSIKPVGGTTDQYEIVYYKNGDTSQKVGPVTVTITDAKDYENILKTKVMLSDKDGGNISAFTPTDGEFFGYTEVQEEIQKYEDQLDQIAKALAFAVNAVHSGNDGLAPNDIFVNKDSGTSDAGIKASNIKVNQIYVDNPMLIETRQSDAYGPTDGKRALAIAQLRNQLMDITSIKDSTTRGEFVTINADGTAVFANAEKGMKIDSYFKDIIARLGVQSGEAKRMVKNQETLLSSFQETKESISGVSLDEEMANLIQYQHAYQANAKVISTVDELLDVVINGLKR